MMKWVFGGLLLANVALFLWGRYHYAPVVTPAEGPRPAVNVDKMQLLVPPRAARDAKSRATVTGCYRLGPFTSRSLARTAGEQLATRNVVFEIRQTREPLVEGYRVLEGPFPDQQTALRRHGELTQLGQSGHFITRADDQRNIALAFFSRLDSAERYLKQLAKKGIVARLQARTRARSNLYWLAFASTDAALVSSFENTDWGQPRTRLASRPCPGGGR